MSDSAVILSRTPLYDLHVSHGARMVPFAGYEMPVQYPLGVMKEHLHTRAHAGLFDVSHMGQVELHGADADSLAEAASALESLVPVDVIGLPAGKQRYALFTNDEGGILDDLMIFNTGSYLHLVVNAACKAQDIAHLKSKIGSRCEVRVRDDLALLALQGPGAETALKSIASGDVPQTFMQGGRVVLAGIDCLVTRSGYTGEDGFEISMPSTHCDALARALLAAPNVQAHEQPAVCLIGLGARDSLRLEAGLCLYGHDLDTTTTPVEAALIWAMQKVRRTGGARAGGFPGADVILAQLDDASKVKRKRIGLKPEGRAPIREGVELQNDQGQKIGVVTSGGFAPSLNAPIIMCYVDTAYSSTGTKINAMLRGNGAMVTVVDMPFAPHRYKRA
jgi:aminomethyltransferase